jgi:hypothetical protein
LNAAAAALIIGAVPERAGAPIHLHGDLMSHDSTSPASSVGSVGSGDRRRRGPLLRVSRVILWLTVPLAAAVAAGGGWFYLQMRASLPLLDGERAVAGLSGRVEVTRDDLGVPTIAAASQDDVVRALGFLHAQESDFRVGKGLPVEG